MKRRLWIAAAGIIFVIALACGIELWRENRTIKWQTDRIHELQHILTFAENKGADWATDELMMDHIDTFSKKSLYQKWGEPTGNAEAEDEDIWILSDQFQLVVDYDHRDRIECVKVVSSDS